MKALFQVAYIAAFLLWIPLAMVAALQPSVRRRVMVPLVASAIAAAYEAYMSLVWSHTVSNPIRVDILLVMFALGTVDALAGFSFVVGARGRWTASRSWSRGPFALACRRWRSRVLPPCAWTWPITTAASISRGASASRRDSSSTWPHEQGKPSVGGSVIDSNFSKPFACGRSLILAVADCTIRHRKGHT